MEELTELVKSIDKRAWQTRAMAYLLFCCLENPSNFLLNQLSDATCLLFDMLTEQETEIGNLKEYMEDNENG